MKTCGKEMGTSTEHEYLCPHCGAENSLSDYEIRNMYSPQIAHCDNCKCKLEIVPADGIGDNINLVVSEAGEEVLSR